MSAQARARIPSGRPRSRWSQLSAAVLLSLSTTFVGSVAAHTPPLVSSVSFDPEGAPRVYATNRGLIFQGQASDSLRLLCNEALKINTTETAKVALVEDEHLLIATTAGLVETFDHGCTISEVEGFGGVVASALAQSPADPRHVFVATYEDSGTTIRESRDAGRSWALSVELEPADFVTSLLVGGSSYVYATGSSYPSNGETTFFLLRSTDAGQSWERVPLPGRGSDYEFVLFAVGPDQPESLIVGSVALNPSVDNGRLLVSHDAGDRFDDRFQGESLAGASFGQPGEIWVATRQGLFNRSGVDADFQAVSSATNLGCVFQRGNNLWVCGHYQGLEAGLSGVGTLGEEFLRFEPRLRFRDVAQPVACSPDSETSAQCALSWLDWEREILLPNSKFPQQAGDASQSATSLATSEETGSTQRATDHPLARNDSGSTHVDASSSSSATKMSCAVSGSRRKECPLGPVVWCLLCLAARRRR